MRALLIFAGLAAVVPVCAQTQLVLDDFEYPSAEAIQQAWVTAEGGEPAGLFERDGGTALRMNADFTGEEQRRSVYDRDVELDLSRWGRFTLDIYIDQPGLFGSFTIYFRSGAGWYGAPVGIGRQGWNTVEISRADFKVEDTPAGWDQIDGIRLSAWRGSDGRGFMAVDSLVAYSEPYVIVTGTNTIRAGGGEAKTVQSVASTVAGLLADAGIRTSTIGDEDVERGALADYDFAIFPYNPNMSDEEVAAIREYVDGGGHIMAFYSLHAGLGEILGVRGVGWQQQEYEGQMSEIRFEDAAEFQGLPEAVTQRSWNLTVVEPTEGARVIGWWYDGEGNRTDLPAFVASDAGLYMSHILTETGRPAKQRMLVAMLGRYVPEIWPQVARRALDGPGQIGHLAQMDEVPEWVEAQAAKLADPAAIRDALAAHRTLLADAREAFAAEEFARATDVAGQAWERLRSAFVLAQTPRDAEFRAWWNHSGTGAFGSWEESMQHLEDNGFNAIVPNMLWGGVALYESDYLPEAAVVAERGDQIAECVEAAKRHGIEVHVWKVNWNLGSRAPREFVEQMRQEGRLQQGPEGQEVLWLCPSDPRNLELELNTMVEVARKYDVDGVHFDYIRYPGSEGCYCPRCRQRFEESIGRTVENWPQDLRTPELRPLWTQFRCDNISALVEATAREVRAIKPHCKISAAVFGAYPASREGVGQDWVYWIEQGWLDFVCPMNYITSDETFAVTVARQMEQVGGRVPLYSGVGAWRLGSADRVAGQVQIARNLGADGFILFDYTAASAAEIAPGLGAALLAEPAILPHNAPRYVFGLGGELRRERTYGLHVQPGATVTATVTRAERIEGRSFGKELGQIVLQDADGRTVAEISPAPQRDDDPVRVTVTLPGEGLFRLAVVGEYDRGDGQVQAFVTRSLPIVAGDIAPEVADLL
mgnify:CR=1 FL=1